MRGGGGHLRRLHRPTGGRLLRVRTGHRHLYHGDAGAGLRGRRGREPGGADGAEPPGPFHPGRAAGDPGRRFRDLPAGRPGRRGPGHPHHAGRHACGTVVPPAAHSPRAASRPGRAAAGAHGPGASGCAGGWAGCPAVRFRPWLRPGPGLRDAGGQGRGVRPVPGRRLPRRPVQRLAAAGQPVRQHGVRHRDPAALGPGGPALRRHAGGHGLLRRRRGGRARDHGAAGAGTDRRPARLGRCAHGRHRLHPAGARDLRLFLRHLALPPARRADPGRSRHRLGQGHDRGPADARRPQDGAGRHQPGRPARPLPARQRQDGVRPGSQRRLRRPGGHERRARPPARAAGRPAGGGAGARSRAFPAARPVGAHGPAALRRLGRRQPAGGGGGQQPPRRRLPDRSLRPAPLFAGAGAAARRRTGRARPVRRGLTSYFC
ncbi:PE-PGRS family protein [Nitrospirillum viridazoti Y2]|nr:PE-PGRS family protein [Nitrospirillum amazonense Y2]